MPLEEYLHQLAVSAFFCGGEPKMTPTQRARWYMADGTKMYSWDRKHGCMIDRNPEEGGK